MSDLPEEKAPANAGLTPEQVELVSQYERLAAEDAARKARILAPISPYKWKKGVSGNPSGKSKDGSNSRLPLRKLLKQILQEQDPDAPDGVTRLEALLRQGVHHGARKSFKHYKDVLDRVDEDGPSDGEKVFKVMPVRKVPEPGDDDESKRVRPDGLQDVPPGGGPDPDVAPAAGEAGPDA